jgi:hypothetical protein
VIRRLPIGGVKNKKFAEYKAGANQIIQKKIEIIPGSLALNVCG